MQWRTEVWSTKMYKLCCKSGKYFKRDHVTPLLRDLKWINFNSILQLNDASFVYKNLYVSADSNVTNINFDFRNKVSQRLTRNGSDDIHIIEEQHWARCIKLGGETGSAIRWRKRTVVTSPRGSEEHPGSWMLKTFLKFSLKTPTICCEFACYNN